MNKLLETSYALGTNTPSAWRMAAQTNLVASEILAKEVLRARDAINQTIDIRPKRTGGNSVFDSYFNIDSTTRPCLMLLGLGIECILKGIRSGYNLKLDSFDSEPNKSLFDGSHNLKGIAEKMDLGLTVHELKILESLGRYIEWKGRYIVPRKVEKYKDDWKKTFNLNPYLFIESNEREVFNDSVISLLNKLGSILNQSVKKEFSLRRCE